MISFEWSQQQPNEAATIYCPHFTGKETGDSILFAAHALNSWTGLLWAPPASSNYMAIIMVLLLCVSYSNTGISFNCEIKKELCLRWDP